MITVAIPMGSQPDILTLVTRARSELASTLADKLQFVVFDSGSNVDQADTWTFHQARDEAHAVTQAVGLVAQGKADILLKGIVQTHTLLKELLRPDYQLAASESFVSCCDYSSATTKPAASFERCWYEY